MFLFLVFLSYFPPVPVSSELRSRFWPAYPTNKIPNVAWGEEKSSRDVGRRARPRFFSSPYTQFGCSRAEEAQIRATATYKSQGSRAGGAGRTSMMLYLLRL